MSGTELIRVLVVDDHAVVREGIRHVLSEGAGFAVVGEAQSGTEAIASAAQLMPNVVVLDISMPGGSGLRAVGGHRDPHPAVRGIESVDHVGQLGPPVPFQGHEYTVAVPGEQDQVKLVRSTHVPILPCIRH